MTDPAADEVLAVMARQRAHRSFSGDDVDDEVVTRVLTAATWAPSAENRQPWELIVVRSAPARAAIGEVMASLWSRLGPVAASLDPALADDVTRGATGGIASAPVLVVVCVDRDRAAPGPIGSSVFPAVQNLLLAATACGLGSALTTLATHDRAGLADVLALPDHVDPVAVIPLGWPARSLGPPRRDPLQAHLHRDRWDG